MMEFSNPEHQQQDLHGGSSSLQPSPSFHLVGANHDWNHNLILNGCGFIPNGRDFHEVSSNITNAAPPTLSTHMIQDLGFHWSAPPEGYMNHPGHESTLDRIKEGLSSASYPKPTEAIRNPSDFNLASTSCIKSEQQELLLRTLIPSGCQTSSLEPQGRGLLLDSSFGAAPAHGRGGYSMVLPTTDISIANSSSSSSSSPMYPVSLGMDLQALDLMASARFGRSLPGPFGSMSLFRDGMPFGLGHLQDPAHEQASNSHHKISSLVSGVAEMKRVNSTNLENKACQPVQKKPRFETRSSCSPFKVRKEKLGDRIAALQQLVAPFGKTDTASVLMEAIGYIKFLQDQVETLSVPYMQSSNSKKLRTTQGASSCEDGDEHRPDLRSRGLCLVPLSCTSYVTNENGGIWSPTNFRESD